MTPPSHVYLIISRSDVELFEFKFQMHSLIFVFYSAVQLIGRDYQTNNCHCRIKDVACSIW